MQSRRAQARAETLAQIRAAALRQVAEEGAAALSIRGVAREIGMSPAGLYRYFDGRDALLTDLLTDAYLDLAAAVATAAGLPSPPVGDRVGVEDLAHDRPVEPSAVADPMAALLRAIQAYRTWGVCNPERFLLIFGTPVPGYAAPEQGPTVEANRRMGEVFFTLAALAWRDGWIAPTRAPATAITTGAQAELLAQLQSIAPGFPAELIPVMISGWALWHGMVTLEITNQLDWIYPDTAAFFTERMTDWLEGFAGRQATP